MPNSPKLFADISVVIPAFNAEETILRALGSVANQSLRPKEVIVIDDGSKDATYEVATKYYAEMNNISLIVIRQENKGAGAARNRALKEASQPIIAFLDADDEWLPEKLDRSLHHMGKNNYTLVAHNGYIVEDGKESIIDGARRFREAGSPFVSLYKKGYLDTCTVVAKRSALIEAGGFDESLPNAQDFELWLRVLQKPETEFLVFDEVLSRYYVVPGSIMSHTERRLSCCLDIARRFAPNLAAHSSSSLKGLWFRIIAVYYEGINTYWRKRTYPKCFALLLRLPITILICTIEYFFNSLPPRQNFLTQMHLKHTVNAARPIRQKALTILLYAWIVLTLGLYLYQFKNLVGPVLRVMGFK